MIVCDRSLLLLRDGFCRVSIVATFRLLSFEGLMADVQWRSAWLTGEVSGVRCQVSGVRCSTQHLTLDT